jgi:hypothetical protein
LRYHYSSLLIKTEAKIDIIRIEIIIPREITIDISKWKNEASIFSPTNVRTKARPTLRKRKYPIIPAKAKYSDRKPSIANILEV